VSSEEPFALFDCSLARNAIGRSCSNLRELLDAIRTVPDGVLEHHMIRCVLEDHFELNEFPNDLARWCWEALGEQVLGEQLGLVDPYQQASIAALRNSLANVIEGRLWETERVPWCRPGLELHLVRSQVIAYDTGQRFATLAALAEALPRIPLRSFYYHVHEARWRRGRAMDDFSAWLEMIGADQTLVERLRAIDFYFLNLHQLQEEFIETFRRFLAEPHLLKVTA
jgi:Family of unknown function (DUF5752)